MKLSPIDGSVRDGDMNHAWHIITPEYPPRIGGVSDYTSQVAAGLRNAGDDVHVWVGWSPGNVASRFSGENGVQWLQEGLTLAGLKRLGGELDRFPAPRRLLVQWVPHGFGWRSMNILFCLWLWKRAKRGDRVEIMLHEAFLQFGEGNLRRDGTAVVHRLMTVILLKAASHVWMSTASWEPMWRPYCLGRPVPFVPLPVPANIPVLSDADLTQAVRRRYAPHGETIIGHFGTHGNLVTRMLDPVIPRLLRERSDRVCLLIGQSSERYRDDLLRANPDLAGRILASGAIDAGEISLHLQVCELLLQPYPEGITTRRTTAMAALAHGIPMVSSCGPMTESFWGESGALVFGPYEQPVHVAALVETLLGNPARTRQVGQRARSFYDERFETRHVIRTLRREAAEAEREDKAACCVSR
jgi:glycosyltransferase involved in cell wall biosynthesis